MTNAAPPIKPTPSVFTVALAAFVIALVVAVVLGVVGALTGPDHTDDGQSSAQTTPQIIVWADPVTTDEAERCSGVAELLDDVACTASLVDTGVATAPAYIITNRHCTTARTLDTNEVSLDAETEGTAVFGPTSPSCSSTPRSDPCRHRGFVPTRWRTRVRVRARPWSTWECRSTVSTPPNSCCARDPARSAPTWT